MERNDTEDLSKLVTELNIQGQDSSPKTLENLLIQDEKDDRCVGALLGVMVGDVLGAPVEGERATTIAEQYPSGVVDFVSAPIMGVEWRGPRYGTYTDDTQTTLALAGSLVECQGLNPLHAARSYGDETHIGIERGYPPTARAVLKAVLLRRTSILKTGTIAFPNGSFANGGAMRITPVGIAFRNATDDELYEAVRMAIISSHVHPEAIDGAFIQAKAVSILLKENSETFQPLEFLATLESIAKTDSFKKKLSILQTLLKKVTEDPSVTNESIMREISSASFQIKAIDAVPTAIWGFVRYYKNPEDSLVKTVGFGGDTDTTASMTGALLGALYGTSWIPRRWFDNIENDEHGRDYCVELGRKLAKLDLHELLPFDESEPCAPNSVPRHIG